MRSSAAFSAYRKLQQEQVQIKPICTDSFTSLKMQDTQHFTLRRYQSDGPGPSRHRNGSVGVLKGRSQAGCVQFAGYYLPEFDVTGQVMRAILDSAIFKTKLLLWITTLGMLLAASNRSGSRQIMTSTVLLSVS